MQTFFAGQNPPTPMLWRARPCEAICISPTAGEAMVRVERVQALAGQGLVGDRYATGTGSFNKGKQGIRQVTFINSIFFHGSGFVTRRVGAIL